MNLELTLITLAAWFFVAKNFSTWKWVTATTKIIFPGPLGSLWKALTTCSFCGGFWIALGLRKVTAWQTLPELSQLHPGLDWTLDALATAMLATLVAVPLEWFASQIKPVQAQRSMARPSQSQRSPSSSRPQPSSQRPRNSSAQRPQGQPRPSPRPPAERPSNRNFQQAQAPRRPNPRGVGS